jgi:CDGSH-type Zn-finger protein
MMTGRTWMARHSGGAFRGKEEDVVGAPQTGGTTVAVTENGPYLVTGSVPLARQTIVADADGFSVEWRQGETLATEPEYRLCRCGRSRTKPFCDDSHERVGFDGTETASREPYLKQAYEEDGPTVILTDAEQLCAFARFCDPGGQVWSLVERDEPASAELAVREAKLCPSGRLVAWDRGSGHRHEPDLEASIGVVEDPTESVSGPLWLRGGIQLVAADGYRYEVRNRMTLCRCGGSRNKPFCDGTHAAIGFRDGIEPAVQA